MNNKKMKLTSVLLAGVITAGLSFQTQASIISSLDVSELNDFSLVYGLNIATNSNFKSNPVGYSENNSASNFGTIDRVAYYLQLDTSWVWVSFDALTQNLSAIGVPVLSTLWDQKIDNMRVFSNVNGVTTGSFASGGNIEFWSNCYSTGANSGLPSASGSSYDFDDTRAQASCYGSMQIHNYSLGKTLLAYNAWDEGGVDDLGIGSRTTLHPDWTFARNATSFNTRRLEVFVSSQSIRSAAQVSEPGALALFGLGIVGLFFRRKTKK